MIIRNILFVFALTFLGCVSQIPSANDFAKSWVGESIDRYKKAYERSKPWNTVKRKNKGDQVIYHVIENHFDFGSCYTDLIVDIKSKVIVDYQVYGDEYACR